ncbi:MAG: hypothetical protein RL114_321 [Actinomycetota bacterium]
MDIQFKNLRKLNMTAGFLHLFSLLAILFLSTDASLPVIATYMSDAPGTGSFAAPIELFSLNISYTVAAFMALSAFFHFFVSSGPIFPKYVDGLKRHINIYRWIEYSLSSSIMIVIILQLNGVTDYIALIAIFGVNVSMILFGWLQERYVEPGSGDMRPFWFGCIAGAVPWVAIFINMLSPSGPPETTVPGFVIGIVISLFIFFNCFALVQWKQYKAEGKWADYLYGERWYIILSFVAKSLLAWQVFTGALV